MFHDSKVKQSAHHAKKDMLKCRILKMKCRMKQKKGEKGENDQWSVAAGRGQKEE